MPKVTVNRELLLSVAKNARLELTDAEIKLFLPQLQEILKAFEKIDSVDVKGIEPAFHPIPLQNRWREDVVTPSLPNEDALKNSVHKKPPYFKGPKAIE